MRVQQGNFALSGLTGQEVGTKTAGIIGTGAIGKALAKILLVWARQGGERGHCSVETTTAFRSRLSGRLPIIFVSLATCGIRLCKGERIIEKHDLTLSSSLLYVDSEYRCPSRFVVLAVGVRMLGFV